jgi:hypothetical protein
MLFVPRDGFDIANVGDVATVIVVLVGPWPGVTVEFANEIVTPWQLHVAVSVTGDVNGTVTPDSETVYVAESPGFTTWFAGDALIAKSDAANGTATGPALVGAYGDDGFGVNTAVMELVVPQGSVVVVSVAVPPVVTATGDPMATPKL